MIVRCNGHSFCKMRWSWTNTTLRDDPRLGKKNPTNGPSRATAQLLPQPETSETKCVWSKREPRGPRLMEVRTPSWGGGAEKKTGRKCTRLAHRNKKYLKNTHRCHWYIPAFALQNDFSDQAELASYFLVYLDLFLVIFQSFDSSCPLLRRFGFLGSLLKKYQRKTPNFKEYMLVIYAFSSFKSKHGWFSEEGKSENLCYDREVISDKSW